MRTREKHRKTGLEIEEGVGHPTKRFLQMDRFVKLPGKEEKDSDEDHSCHVPVKSSWMERVDECESSDRMKVDYHSPSGVLLTAYQTIRGFMTEWYLRAGVVRMKKMIVTVIEAWVAWVGCLALMVESNEMQWTSNEEWNQRKIHCRKLLHVS